MAVVIIRLDENKTTREAKEITNERRDVIGSGRKKCTSDPRRCWCGRDLPHQWKAKQVEAAEPANPRNWTHWPRATRSAPAEPKPPDRAPPIPPVESGSVGWTRVPRTVMLYNVAYCSNYSPVNYHQQQVGNSSPGCYSAQTVTQKTEWARNYIEESLFFFLSWAEKALPSSLPGFPEKIEKGYTKFFPRCIEILLCKRTDGFEFMSRKVLLILHTYILNTEWLGNWSTPYEFE